MRLLRAKIPKKRVKEVGKLPRVDVTDAIDVRQAPAGRRAHCVESQKTAVSEVCLNDDVVDR